MTFFKTIEVLTQAVLDSVPFVTPEGTELMKSLLGVSLRSWYLMAKHMIEATFTLVWMLVKGEAVTGEVLVATVLQMPKEFNDESSDDSELVSEVVRVEEALCKAYLPVYAYFCHPHMRTEKIPATKEVNSGLWVWSSEEPIRSEDVVVLYYIHGGGYCFFDGVTSHLELVTNMVETMQAKLRSDGWKDATVVAYILSYDTAPKKILPTQLQEVVKGYKFLLSQDRFPVKSDHVVVGGDSAGASLSLGFLKCLAENDFCENLPRPACCLALEPCVDMAPAVARKSLDISHDILSNGMIWHCVSVLYGRPSHPGERMDTVNHPLESDSYVQKAGKFDDKEWVRVREMAPDHRMEKHPLFSVAYGKVDPQAFGNVPILLQVGGAEALRDDIDKFATEAQKGVCYEVYDRMIHVFPMFSSVIPLGQTAINRWADFVSKAIRGEKLPIGKAYAISRDRVETLDGNEMCQKEVAMAQAASVMQLSWRTRLYLCLHIFRVLRDILQSLLQGEGSSLELFLLKILKAPKEMVDLGKGLEGHIYDMSRDMLSNVMVWIAGMALTYGERYTSPAEDNADGTGEWRVVDSKELFSAEKGSDGADLA
ncbi:hypothetical protein FOZ61_007219 [Perkinsus olseni]|uniref:Alpha/beta hydrolase fold-3 domain-containing protein n=1 Tax=Perkinsus olseni TaxID=32597 RepID=A0A7J6LJE9_PEROL|nr:hypothetical protein FOZ61_007219 [Perkinsus olseni]KAF4659419.1 hypothetical protein FOL46_006602 [Perkinsus olseni]